MIKTEFYRQRNDEVNLYRTYSDEGYMIIQNETGITYTEAIDVEDAPYTYSETNEPIEDNTDAEDMTETIEKAKAYDILMGVNV